jgi:hypothetical protein
MGGAAIADPYSAKPWLKFYDKHVPPNLEYPEKTSLAYFREAVKSVPRVIEFYGRTSDPSRWQSAETRVKK